MPSPLESRVISFPAMHLTVEWGEPGSVRHGHPLPATLVHGLVSQVFRVTLAGQGGVAGARFRADGFHAWSGFDAADLTDRVVPAGELLGDGSAACTPVSARTPSRTSSWAVCDRALERRRPTTAPSGVGPVVDLMAGDPSLIRVDQVARSVAVSERTLQRRFRREIGIGPKWVLSRYRLQEAALALERDPDADLGELARAGVVRPVPPDQHVRGDVGEPPARYARGRPAVATGRVRRAARSAAAADPGQDVVAR